VPVLVLLLLRRSCSARPVIATKCGEIKAARLEPETGFNAARASQNTRIRVIRETLQDKLRFSGALFGPNPVGMRDKPLKIAYLCDFSPLDRNLYSGGNARIYDSLCAHVGEVTILSNHWGLVEPLRRLMHAMPDKINLRARWRLHLALGRVIARSVRAELARGQYDVLFTAYSFQSLAAVKPPYPMVTAFTSDATMTGYKRSEIGQSFGSFFAPARLMDPLILRAERRIFQAQDLLLWPGEWQKQTADALYGLREGQSVVVPWGGNVEDPGPGAPLAITPDAPVRILFVGRDWWAKGGPLVAEMVGMLRARGVDARLTVIGCTPPLEAADWLSVHPQLDKAIPEQLATFQAQLRAAHFLFMASFESWGFAFCEASAYGLPSLAYRIGGVPVRDGVNGHAMAPETGAEPFADIVTEYLHDPARYAALRASARREYERNLNWDVWAQRAARLFREKLAEKSA